MKRWRLCNKNGDFQAIMEKYEVDEIIARLLVNREIEGDKNITKFLSPSMEFLPDPFLMKDMQKAVERIKKFMDQGKRIRIIGDYDVDGILSTYVLQAAFKQCYEKVDYRIPDRQKDGYGINRRMIEEAKEDGISLIITCDNGISAYEEITYAKTQGLEVIVTDHHEIPEKAPFVNSVAFAVINPKQADCPYPFKKLCGAAVALKLMEAFYLFLQKPTPVEEYLEYIALATVCDIVDLEDENRILVKLGLEKLKQTTNVGLLALLEQLNLTKEQLGVYHLGYFIGPCLNASGRLESAMKGLSLLCETSQEKAQSLAEELIKLNQRRKQLTEEGVKAAIHIIETSNLKDASVLVVYLQDCHESVAGIIAGRLRERYYKPVLVLTKAEEGVKGSGRSIEGYHMFESLCACSSYLTRFGGHPMAAGLSMQEDQIDSLRQALNQQCMLSEEDLQEKILLDAVVPLGLWNERMIHQLELLEPFGKGNRKPLFAERNLQMKKATYIGKTTKYFKFLVQNQYGKEMDALYFGDAKELELELVQKFGQQGVEAMLLGRENPVSFSVAYYPSINEYRGRKSIQIMIQYYLL